MRVSRGRGTHSLLVLGRENGNTAISDYTGVVFPYSPLRTNKLGIVGTHHGDPKEMIAPLK